LDRRQDGPQSHPGRGGEEKNSQLLPGLELKRLLSATIILDAAECLR